MKFPILDCEIKNLSVVYSSFKNYCFYFFEKDYYPTFDKQKQICQKYNLQLTTPIFSHFIRDMSKTALQNLDKFFKPFIYYGKY